MATYKNPWYVPGQSYSKEMFITNVEPMLHAGFVWLFMYDWKLAIAVFFILWGNNVSTKDI